MTKGVVQRRRISKAAAAALATTIRTPRWLRPISKLHQQLVALSQGEGDVGALDFPAVAPFTAPTDRCKDVKRMYQTLAYWCVDFQHAPKHFLAAWFDWGTPETRRELLERFGAFRAELDEERWRERMFARDDKRMLSAVFLWLVRQRRSSGGGGGNRKNVAAVVDALVCSSIEHHAKQCLNKLVARFPTLAKKRLMAWLMHAAQHGSIAAYDVLWDAVGKKASRERRMAVVRSVLIIAAGAGQIKLLQHMQDRSNRGGGPWLMALRPQFEVAARCEKFATLLWLQKLVRNSNMSAVAADEYERYAFVGALRGAKVHVLDWLVAPETGWVALHMRHRLVDAAAVTGDRRVVQWLLDRGANHLFLNNVVSEVLTSPLANSPELVDYVRWLIDQGAAVFEMNIDAAVENGRDEEMIQLLRNSNPIATVFFQSDDEDDE